MGIGLALSGGGFRATGFHLGVIARLAKEGHLEDVSFLSTVSGGSLCVGLLHALNGFRWPSSDAYLESVLPQARRVMTTVDLQRELLKRVLRAPWRILEARADRLSSALRDGWGIKATLGELPRAPRWMINATCYETGGNWRFERFRMGDYLYGYTYDTQGLPLSDALAASAGFPGLIGALPVDASRYRWFRYAEQAAEPGALADPEVHQGRKTESIVPDFQVVHLWDGGVYDNHGLEGLHDFIDGWRKEVGFLIVSDGAGKPVPERYRPGARALKRIITGIMMNQVRSLRARAIIERFVNHGDRGGFLQIGNTCRHVFRQAGRIELIERFCSGCLSEEQARIAETMPTVIRRLTGEEFERLFRHGFEVADYTLHAYAPREFGYLGYGESFGA